MERVPTTIIFVSTRLGSESRNYWIEREGAELVLIPDIERFGEKDKVTGQQNWEDVPANSSMEGLLLPRPPEKSIAS